MKLTLMRDNSGTLTMRTLDITLQIEAMKHETKARPISNLRTSIRHASPDCKLEEAQKTDESHPCRQLPQNNQRNTNDRIQRHRANRSKPPGKQDGSKPCETGSGRTHSNPRSLHGFQRTLRKNMAAFHTPGQITTQKPGRSGNIPNSHAYRKAVGLCQPALSYAIELKNRHWINSAGKPTIRNFITIPTLPSFICANH